jgi:ABC-type antimicrobial peptide transport system permease subunit
VKTAVGFILAVIGVYGMVSYTVASRMREFGIRLALGEERKYIFLRSITGAGRAVLPGVVLGILFSLATGKLLESQLFGIRAMDVPTLAALALLLTFIAAMASILAARHAASIDPLTVLRE